MPEDHFTDWMNCYNCKVLRAVTVQPENNNVNPEDATFMPSLADRGSFTSYAYHCAKCGARLCSASKQEYDEYVASASKSS